MRKRARMPKLGGRKLYHELKADFNAHGFKIGRDRFFQLLREAGQLVKRRKRYARTTQSEHAFRIYDNKIRGLNITHPNQVLVSDMTYLRSGNRFVYLALVSDLYSRKILGYDVSGSLGIEGSLRALQMALQSVGPTKQVIHHSDRGIQYCSHAYVKTLKDHQIHISMSAKGNPYENAVAERINGILKEEFLLKETFPSLEVARRSAREAIRIYNQERPHMSLNMKKPSEVYKEGRKAA